MTETLTRPEFIKFVILGAALGWIVCEVADAFKALA